MAGLLLLGGFAFFIFWHRALRAEVRRTIGGEGSWEWGGEGDGGGDCGGGGGD